MLDFSQSISQQEFDAAKQFIYEFASEFEFGTNAARFGIVLYSSESTNGVQIELGGMESISGFKQAVSTILIQPGTSSTNEAIQMATEEFITNGQSDNVPKTMLVLTNRRFSDRKATIQAAARARAIGINVLAIGIGSVINEDELNAIATNPDDRYVVMSNDFAAESFNSIRRSVVLIVCCK